MKHNQPCSDSDRELAGVPVNFKFRMRIALVVRLVTKASRHVLHLGHFGDLNSCVIPYFYFDNDEAQFKVLQNWPHGFSPTCRRYGFWDDFGPRTSKSNENSVLWSRDQALDATFRVFTGFMVCALHNILTYGDLFRLDKPLLE